MWLAFDSVDVWFFRDGRPFDAGDAHAAHSRFPPPPETMLGAVRALLLEARFARLAQPGISLEAFGAWLRGGAPDGTSGTPEAIFASARQQLGDGSGIGTDLTLRGPFLMVERPDQNTVDDAILLSAPRDLRRKSPTDTQVIRLHPLEPGPGELGRTIWSPAMAPDEIAPGDLPAPPCPLVAETDSGEELSEVSWLTLAGLKSYLEGEAAQTVTSGEAAWTFEQRSGIALKPSRATREGHLYTLEMVRPVHVDKASTWAWKRARLLVDVELASDSDRQAVNRTLLPFGGERRLAHAGPPKWTNGELISDVPLSSLLRPEDRLLERVQEAAAEKGWLRVVLLQPAIFEAGWLPNGIQRNGLLNVDQRNHEGKPTGEPFKFRLRGAAVGKPLAISGWDLANQAPKPLRRAVPAGSVYYFQHIGESDEREDAINAFFRRYHGIGGSFCHDRDWRAGYGVSVVGACEPRVTQE